MAKDRVDKIFNNTYHTGQHLKDDFTASNEIKIDKAEISGTVSEHEDFDSYAIYKSMQKEILELIENDKYLKEKFDLSVKKKFNKEILNDIFGRMREHFRKERSSSYMFNVIYLFDIISGLTGIKTKTLFDFLKYEFKSELVVELDKTTNILTKTNKMF